jgi:high-affinity iron transporter
MKLKFIFNFTALLALAAWLPAPAAAQPQADGGAAQRLVSLIDYIGGDYRLAVQDGAVVAPDEYEEQRRFAAETRRMAARLLPGASEQDRLLQVLARIETLVAGIASPDEVGRACREAHDLAVSRFRLETRPLQRPSLSRGEALYAEGCAICHGPAGQGDGVRAAELDPQPASFKDPGRLPDFSPYRVYNALTFGVPGTAMPAFELQPQERWDLAFYVLRLGHTDEPADGPVPVTLADLAGRSDRELRAGFAVQPGADPATRLAWARTEGPYLEPAAGADLARARALLREAVQLLDAGRAAEADGRVLDAYLQGFEPSEPRLRVRDAAATRSVEASFHALRAELLRGDAERAREQARRLDAQLVAIANESQPLVPFVAAALIYLREGLEAALLIGALLAGVARLGRPRAALYIHAGWLLALPAGLLTFWILMRLVDLGAAQRELMEAGVALLAAAVLFFVSFWLISKAESRRWTAYLQERVQKGLDSRNLLVLTGLSFLAAYREVAETALFTQALLLDAKGQSAEVWAGAATGLLCVAAVAFGLNRTVVRLPIAPFFAVSSLLLLGLAVSFAGSGIYELVTAGYLRPRPVPLPSLPWLGIHPDLTVLLVQLSIVSVVVAAGLATLRRGPVAVRDDEATGRR